VGQTNISLTLGQNQTFNMTLDCDFMAVYSDWATDSDLCTVNITYDDAQNPLYTVQCANNLTEDCHGLIITKWCDMNGGYLSAVTYFDVSVNANNNNTNNSTNSTTNSTTANAITCDRSNASTCKVVKGTADISVNVGNPQPFTLSLDCPVASSQSSWVATFGTCDVEVTFKNGNPTYTVTAQEGAESRGGSIFTEWCDSNGGYLNHTTNFLVQGEPASEQLQFQAECGILVSGTKSFQATSTSSSETIDSNPGATNASVGARTAGAIVGFALLGVFVILMVGTAYYCYSRRNKQPHPEVSEEREGPTPDISAPTNPTTQPTDFHQPPTKNLREPLSPHLHTMDP
jgi:uncharacterized protein YodC (DUF2158 family)